MNAITSQDVLGLLAIKHAADVFVPECKDGPTQFTRGHSRLDAWVMSRSWAHPACTGYEIKVSRADFLGDEKWRAYLPLSNYLYFVAPHDVIEKGEVPESCGLLRVTKSGMALRVAKKAPHRDVEIPEDLWRYILMCRAKITPPNLNGGGVPSEVYWRGWLRQKKEKRELGYNVSRAIRETLRERVLGVEAKQKVIEMEMRPLNAVKAILEEMGVTLYSWQSRKDLRETVLNKFAISIPTKLRRAVQHTAKSLEIFRVALDEFDAEHTPEPSTEENDD